MELKILHCIGQDSGGENMRGLCIQLLHYITEAIDLQLSDDEINARIEEVANRDDIEPNEYCEIYEQAMLAYKVKFGII